MKRVICLYRVSTLGQVDHDDIPMQKLACREYAATHPDWEIVDEISEKGISGYKVSTNARDAIVEIKKRAVLHQFDVLLVFMFDRLGRRDDETPFVVQWFVQQGIEVWSTREGEQRFDTHVDKLLNYIRFWQASGESEKTSMRVKTKHSQMVQEGIYRGGLIPYGYKLEHRGRMNKKSQPVRDLVIDGEEAAVVKLIFDLLTNRGYGTNRVAQYLNDRGMINIGEVTGDYVYVADAHEYVQQRDVKWLKHIPRTFFSQGALYEIGSAMTLFAVKKYADEFLSALDKGFKKTAAVNDEDDTVGATAEDIIESTKDFIMKELSRNLKGYALEEFVADLLRTMRYHTTVSSHGGDSGIDITAYKDELPPRILVQVKSQDNDIKETTIQSLKGVMREGDYGLFVTLSNYTKNAQKYLKNTPIIRGINGTELVDLILKYYDGLDDKYKKMIPLRMVYLPVSKES